MNAGSGPSEGFRHHDDPLTRPLDHLRERSAAFGASFERHLRAEPGAGLPQQDACDGLQLVRILEVLAGRRAESARFRVFCRRLANRWGRRGACAAHCDAAGAALLRSLREVLGSEYDQSEEDWAELYGSAAEAMLVAAAREDAGS